ncbi:fatty acid synthase-like isoform X2 [Rhopalosiphum maidis]|uniref:fatty acid synthase-like isoform X2 n=1 Tax=Rhopalosiphum maidis TaxID=43146 RepID=UPI000EFE3204|nr:fatty acid synthase-like isoform X2 [Rhopalosiphum maidis]
MEDKENVFEVVISGVGGKFPMSENMDELRRNLNNKVNMVTEYDCRWNKDEWPGVPAATGKISVLQKFDDTFMGINSRIVRTLDPLTRCMLERVYEAIIDAGLNPKHFYESKTSVYTASCVSDSEAIGCDEKLTTPFWLLAHVRALLANRVSNIFNLQGPSYTIDSSWIGGIEILKQAAEDVAKGRIKAALVGVTNIIWHPDMAKHWIGLDKLSPDGICKSFDENASGYGRSEGVVVLLLQRSTDALRSYGTILHCDASICMEKAINFIRPSEDSFRDFFKSFYEDCKVSPANICYLESDGSACKYYEEKELNVSSEIFCENQRISPLLIGSIKSNLGHTEGASSLIAIVKALIALDSGIIPPNINYELPNNKIEALKKGKMKVVTEPTKLEGTIVATTTLGMPSSIGHVLLKQNPKPKSYSQLGPSQRLVILSSRTEKGLSEAIDRVKSLPRDDEYLGLIQNAFSENLNGHFHRGYAILNSEASPTFGVQEIVEFNRPVWFVFAGMGSQWPGMASDLMEIPCFADSVRRCDKYIRPIGYDIFDILTNPDPEILEQKPIISFLAIATMHIAFVDLLTKLGIHPDFMFGHSLGENGCGYADGCFNVYETLMAAYSRGKVSEFLKPEKGLMAAVGLNYQNIPDLPSSIDIGCHNSEDNVTLCGPLNDMENYIETLKKQNVFVRTVNSNGIAYHSRMVERQAEFVQKFIEKAVPNPKKRSSKWISTSVPEKNWDSDLAQWCSGEYHANNFKKTVYFSEAIKKIPKNVIVIEIAPHGLFQGILKSSLDSSCKVVSVAKRGSKSPLKHFLTTLGELYSSGLHFNLDIIYPPPEYPVSRGTPSLAPLVSWNHDETWPINTHYSNSNSGYVQLCLRDKTLRHLLGHKVNDAVVVPFSFFIIEVLKSLENKQSAILNKSYQTIFENVLVHTPLISTAEESTGFYTQIQPGSGSFEVTESQNVLLSGLVYMDDSNHLISPEPPTDYEINIENEWISDTEIYRVFYENNIHISTPYSNIQRILIHDKGFLAIIFWKNDLNINLNSMMQLKMFADFQSHHLPLLPSWFRSLVIDKEIIKNISPGSLIYITFDTRTNVIRGPGIEIETLKTSTFPTIEPKSINLNVQKVQLIEQPNPKVQNFVQFLSICMQLVKNTVNLSSSKLKTKLKINDAIFVESFKRLFEIQPFLKADVEEYSNFQVTDLESNHVLLLVTEHLNEKLNKDIKKCTGKVFVLIKNLTVDDTYTTIVQYEHNGSIYRLITRIVKLPNKILEVSTKNSSWTDNIEQGLKSLSSNVSPIVLIKIDSKNSLQVVQKIENIKSAISFRYVILYDGEQLFDLTKTFFREQIFKGLRQNILKNKSWGSYSILPCIDNLSTDLNANKLQKYVNQESELTIKYMDSIKTNRLEDEVCSQYSGIDHEGKNVMGILKYKTKSKRYEIDDILKWHVDSEFTLEESVKYPLAYSMAYYCMVIKARIKFGDSILIHNGCSLDSQAFIRVALGFNCKIYVTTYNNDQSDFLKSLFPKLSSGNILDLSNNKFEIQLRCLTKGKGCDIVINAIPTKFLWASLRCIKMHGSFIHIGSQDISFHTEIGMYMFLKNISLYGVQGLLSIVNSSVETKNHLKHLVENGIKDKIVNKLYEQMPKTNTISTNNINNTEKINETNNSDHSFVKKEMAYVIIGSATNLWIKTVNWLLQQDVKKLIFIINGTNSIMRRSQRTIYSLIQKYSDVSFIMTSAERFNTIKDGEILLREFTSYSKIEALFCIEMSDTKLKNIDKACRNVLPGLKHFICMQSDANEVCESRNDAHSNCINIQCDKSVQKPETILKYMNKLVESIIDSKPISVIFSDPLISEHENSNSISEYLPKTIDELLDLNIDLPEYPRFESCTSKSLPNTGNNSLLPVFIIPGLGVSRIQPLINQIMHPVFCAKFPSYINSVENAALGLLWPLRQIQAEGPFTIVGETWGGNIAVELAKIMEGFGETVNLLLLDGCPFDNKKRLHLVDNVDFEQLGRNSEEKVKKNK